MTKYRYEDSNAHFQVSTQYSLQRKAAFFRPQPSFLVSTIFLIVSSL